MKDTDAYIPMNKLLVNKENGWTFTDLKMPYYEIAKRGIVMWCVNNLEGRWTMLGGNKFGFEHGEDATMFRMQFSA